jgi:hypothetical protein
VEVVNNNGELKLRMPFLNYYQVKIFPKLYFKNIDPLQPVRVLTFRVKLILSKLLWI